MGEGAGSCAKVVGAMEELVCFGFWGVFAWPCRRGISWEKRGSTEQTVAARPRWGKGVLGEGGHQRGKGGEGGGSLVCPCQVWSVVCCSEKSSGSGQLRTHTQTLLA